MSCRATARGRGKRRGAGADGSPNMGVVDPSPGRRAFQSDETTESRTLRDSPRRREQGYRPRQPRLSRLRSVTSEAIIGPRRQAG